VLTADLVNARRRGDELTLVRLGDARPRVVALAEQLILAVRGAVGGTFEDLSAAVDAVEAEARDYRVKDGLAKLLEDRCELDSPDEIPPEELRREIFTRASLARAALEGGAQLDRDAILSEVARLRGTSTDAIERALFADLRSAQIVRAFDALSAEALVALYERGQAQAVLLRAVKVTVDVTSASPAATRAFFRRLKFLRLLHTITRSETDGRRGYRVVIDGPFSLFESITKYGQRLALVLPALEACEAWRLTADVRWGKEKRPLVFRLEGKAPEGKRSRESPDMPDEVRALMESFAALTTPWRVSAKTEILELPGVGLTVPDLVFERDGGGKKPERVFLEVMGYWSRDAVWKRVELVQAGLDAKVLFAVSSRLRVSEEVLGGELPSALYVYKGTMSARVVAERLDALASRARPPLPA
jgi:predicted nuclease of restriction endonuclease-like RecB superfamily